MWKLILSTNLDIEPRSVATVHVVARKGRPHAWRQNQQWLNNVKWLLKAQGRPKHAATGPCMVMIGFYTTRTYTARPDLDNLEKGVLDALVSCGYIKDDSLVVDKFTFKRRVAIPHIEICVWEWTGKTEPAPVAARLIPKT